MAATAREIIKGTRARLTRDGMVVTQPYLVEGLTSGTNSGRLIQALNTVTATKAALYSQHPDWAGIYADEFDPQPYLNSRTKALVNVTWHPAKDVAGTGSVTFEGSLQNVTTNYDVNRVPIKILYKPTAAGATDCTPQIGQVSGTKAIGVLTIESVVSTNPKAKLIYLNKTNSSSFLGQAAYTWMVSGITYRRAKGQPGWNLRITIQYDEETFIKTTSYRDMNGNIPEDIDASGALLKTLGQFNGYTNSLINGATNLSGLVTGINVDF